jgi:hypothetical protein
MMDGGRICKRCWRVVVREELRSGWFRVVRMEGEGNGYEIG